MKVVIQRVSEAAVKIDGEIVGNISHGLTLLVGFKIGDTNDQVEKMVQKIIKMRLFNDNDGKMNLSLLDVKGSLLIISQFTLYGNTQKGNRPSFIEAARPEEAIALYQHFLHNATDALGKKHIQNGIFGADMKVSLTNDGPVTITLEL